jgi:hypothetical protein
VTGIAAAGTQLDGSTLIGNKRYYAGQITWCKSLTFDWYLIDIYMFYMFSFLPH